MEGMGLVHIYCGDGKGKTSAAMGLALRAAGRGNRVVVARFLKSEDSGEVEMLKKIPEIQVIPCERSFGFTFQMDEKTKKEAAQYYGELFLQAVKAVRGGADMLVLDEIMAAVNSGMVKQETVVEFLRTRPAGLEVVMTGRSPSEEFLSLADYVSEIKKVKHPYDRGILARKGIEY